MAFNERFRNSKSNTSYQVCAAATPWFFAWTTGWRLDPWFSWKLCTMPHCNNPNDIDFDFIKKSEWRYDHLPVGEFWKFRYDSFQTQESPQTFAKTCFGMLSKSGCCRRFIPRNICESRQKLGSGRRREADFHDGSWDRIKSASARTVSRSYPSPISISFSPLAKSLRISLSCSDFLIRFDTDYDGSCPPSLRNYNGFIIFS